MTLKPFHHVTKYENPNGIKLTDECTIHPTVTPTRTGITLQISQPDLKSLIGEVGDEVYYNELFHDMSLSAAKEMFKHMLMMIDTLERIPIQEAVDNSSTMLDDLIKREKGT